jgi:LPS O-antigen subunit length determinant protein (WzzB/FepE family)
MAENQITAPANAKQSSDPFESVGGSAVPEDEINLLELAYVLVKYKTIIILFSIFGLAGGYFAAKIKKPTYTADAVITAKASETRQPNLSALGALGGLGGLAATQLNLAGNPGLEKLDIYINSREFNAELIEKYDLIPEMFKFAPKRKTAKVYEQFFDTTNNKWVEDTAFAVPTSIQMADFLSKVYFKNEVDVKTGLLTVSVKSRDSLFSDKVLSACIEHLDLYIRRDVQSEAKANVDYLENQLATIIDPLLRTKLQEMIASEIEKAMVVSRESFKVIDKPFCQRNWGKEKIFYPLAGAAGMFILLSGIVIFINQIFGSGNTNPESRKWVDMIKKQLFKI